MTTQIIDGKSIAEKIRAGLVTEIGALKAQGRVMKIASLLVGDSPPAVMYATHQEKTAKSFGIDFTLIRLEANISEEALFQNIKNLNDDSGITGIMLNKPLPGHIDDYRLVMAISPSKDIEGVHPANLGNLVLSRPGVVPATAAAVMEILSASGISIKGKNVVIVGHSAIVGKPLSLLLLSSPTESATVTVCHIATQELKSHTLKADILVVAAGKPNLIGPDFVQAGAVVIDVGINRVPLTDSAGKAVFDEKGTPKKKTVGDVDFEKVKEIAGMLTPVPGGVGPVTEMMLIKNLLRPAKEY